jgi:hypothetical protein
MMPNVNISRPTTADTRAAEAGMGYKAKPCLRVITRFLRLRVDTGRARLVFARRVS